MRENHAALEVLPDLFQELDALPGRERLLALTEVGDLCRVTGRHCYNIQRFIYNVYRIIYIIIYSDCGTHSLPQGVLAANIFDWGARACVELYRDGKILEIYRQVCGVDMYIALP